MTRPALLTMIQTLGVPPQGACESVLYPSPTGPHFARLEGLLDNTDGTIISGRRQTRRQGTLLPPTPHRGMHGDLLMTDCVETPSCVFERSNISLQ